MKRGRWMSTTGFWVLIGLGLYLTIGRLMFKSFFKDFSKDINKNIREMKIEGYNHEEIEELLEKQSTYAELKDFMSEKVLTEIFRWFMVLLWLPMVAVGICAYIVNSLKKS
ncbi:hypothetical protein D3C71_1453530 [compost metagenome]